MAKAALSIIFVLGLCTVSLAQDADYYKAIQKPSSTPMQAAQFKRLEENALRDFSQPGSYEVLATSFGNTTERVWAVIYGEVYCNLASDPDRPTGSVLSSISGTKDHYRGRATGCASVSPRTLRHRRSSFRLNRCSSSRF